MTEDEPVVPSAEAKLAAAKQAFQVAVLENDLLFDMVAEESARLARQDKDQQLPDFKIEPWRTFKEDEAMGIVRVGLRLSQMGASQDRDMPELSFGLTMYGYLDVVDANTAAKKITASDKLKTQRTPQEQNEAMVLFWDAYLRFIEDTGVKQDGADIGFDMHSGTFDTLENIQTVVWLDSDSPDEQNS